jgi:L-threonylcarbamoyladenylate synthase
METSGSRVVAAPSIELTMSTKVMPISAAAPEADVIAHAARVLHSGGLVAFPTETVYGLGAVALNPTAVARIFAAKGRPAGNPLIVHVADATDAERLVTAWPEAAARLAERFWPGPLTLVLPKSCAVPDIVTAGGPTVAVRVPAHPVALALLRATGLPVAAPSANRSTCLSPTRAEHVLRDLDGRLELVLDAGPTSGGLESTVLDLTTQPPRLLRPGLVAPGEIEAVIGTIARAAQGTTEVQQPLPSPGMMARHYSPSAPLETVSNDGWGRVKSLCRSGQKVGWLTFATPATPEKCSLHGLTSIVMPRDPSAYATRLYAVLHALDDHGVERIVVALPPDTEGWLAVRDRLRRAAVTPKAVFREPQVQPEKEMSCVTTDELMIAGGDAPGAAAPPELPSPAAGVVLLLDGDERHLDVRYYDGPETSRRWLLPREYAEDLVRWWVEHGCAQAPRGGLLSEQGFGRIFVSLLSHTQVYCRGSNVLGGPNITGYQFPRAVVEALASHLRRPE